jgi:hypothetical protein
MPVGLDELEQRNVVGVIVVDKAPLGIGRNHQQHGARAVAGCHLVANQLTAAVGEDRRTVDKARTMLVVAAGAESPDAPAIWRRAAEDRGAAVAGGIARAQSGANFDAGGGRTEKCVRNRSKKMHFRAWLAHQMRNPAHPGAAGNTVNQNRLKPCKERSSGLCRSWNRRAKTQIPATFSRNAELGKG